MIILESEWDEAAGLEQSEPPPETEDAASVSENIPPSYVDVAVADTVPPSPAHVAAGSRIVSAGSRSVPSLVRTSAGSRNHSAVVVGDPPPSASSAAGSSRSERLPHYRDSTDSARTSPVTYTFCPAETAYNAMSVRSQTALIPLYHVAVRLNCFIPSSFITVITRGDEYGEQVGSFEMGLSVRKGTVTLHGCERLIDVVLTKGGSRLSRHWAWRFDNDHAKHLSWTFDSPVKYCYQGTRSVGVGTALVATFTPPPLTPRADGRPSPLATLKVYPDGHKLFDHILMSVLILERRRLSPNT